MYASAVEARIRAFFFFFLLCLEETTGFDKSDQCAGVLNAHPREPYVSTGGSSEGAVRTVDTIELQGKHAKGENA